MSDDFKNHPVSIGEIKSAKKHDGREWSPRDCLISMLREIDNGLDVNLLIISIRYKDGNEDQDRYRFSQSTPDGMLSVGLLEYVKLGMMIE